MALQAESDRVSELLAKMWVQMWVPLWTAKVLFGLVSSVNYFGRSTSSETKSSRMTIRSRATGRACRHRMEQPRPVLGM